MSDLHKKNFNLKLEISKRRDVQIQLEGRMEDLEAKRAEMQDMNDRLVQELEKRDAAIGEAVEHIVRLEAEVYRLTEEKKLDRRIEADESASSTTYPDYRSSTPKPTVPTLAKLKEDAKVVNRMPSFLSEQTEDTETLRRVYLSLNGSALTLPRLDQNHAEYNNPANGLPSPTALSTLSESSFISVYGQRGDKISPGDEEPSTYNGVDGTSRIPPAREVARMTTGRSASANLEGRSQAQGRAHGNSQYNSITEIIVQGSPLQRIERMDPQYAAKRETPRPQSQGTDVAGRASSQKSPGRTRTMDEKRAGLRRVVTDAPGGVRLHEHALPPTPDTISTTTLRRFKNSDDTLAQRNDSSSDRSRSHDALTSVENDDDLPEPPSGVYLDMKALHANAVEKTREFSGSSYFDLPSHNLQRPRSADDTTVSYRRGNDWYSDSGDDEPNAPSIESSDIWMQESGRINRDEGRISPDLFGFPASASRGGWATDAMFGPNSAQPGGASLHSDNIHDLFSTQQAAWSEDAPPPPPNRRSSLHARTGSQSADASFQSPGRSAAQKSPGRRQRFRRNSDDGHARPTVQQPAQPQFYQPAPPQSSEPKKNHYPPIAGGGPRAGLNRLFRRSFSTGASSGKPEVATPTGTDASVTDAPAMGVPYWASKSGVVDDDRSGATPPPILRNPRHSRADSWGLDVAGPLTPGADPGSPELPQGGRTTPTANSPGAGSGTGARRKWLPSFGRSSSLKNKNG